MSKKFVKQLLVVIMVFSLFLTVCEKKTEQPQNSDVVNSSGLKPYHLVMVFPSGSVPKDLPEVQDEMSKYLKEKINATIELHPVDLGSWQDKTNLMFASGEQIDLIFTASWLDLGQQVAGGRFIPLDELMNKYGKGIKSILDPAVIQGGKIDNNIYGVVTNKEFASSKGILMRKDLVEKYKIDVNKLKELRDFDPVFEKIKKNEPGVTPLQVNSDHSPFTEILGNGLFDVLGDSLGILDRKSKELKVIDLFETPEYMAYAKLMRKWFEEGYINKDAAIQKDNEAMAVKAGKAFAYAFSVKPSIETQEARNTGVPMVAVELTKPYMTTGDTMSAMFAIPTVSKDPQRAMMFLNLLYTDKYLINLLNWGIEGKHFIKKSNNIIDYPQGVNAMTTGYNLNQSWMFGNQLNSYLWTTDDPHLWEKYKTFNQTAEKSLALGFVFNPDNVKSEIAAVNNASSPFTAAIITGSLDPEKTIPQFVEKLKSAGLDKIIAEKQRQLDEWAKANKK